MLKKSLSTLVALTMIALAGSSGGQALAHSPAEPVFGYLGAPNGAPQLLNKTISYCMDDPIYQPGTTMFTDGTTGWTTYCAGLQSW